MRPAAVSGPMRLALTFALCGLLLCAPVRPAAAEPSRSLDALVPSSGALALMLAPPSAEAEPIRRSQSAGAVSRSAGSEDPDLTVAIERMWFLGWPVRAFRRPGGAEVIVRGHF